MKRFIALSLMIALAMLAASCESPPQEVPEPSAPAGTASPSETAPASPVETPKTTSIPYVPPPSSKVSVVLPNGPLPDEPYTKAAIQPPKRYYAETMLGLVASDKYGRIVPYIGGTVSFYSNEQSNIFGLCDLSGRIVCDPVYNAVWIISNGETSLYALKVNKISFVEKNENGYTYYYSYADNSTIKICPPDGSWTQTYDSVQSMKYTYYASIIYDYITAKKNEKWGVVGYNGDIILPFQYNSPVCFSEGLASVSPGDGKTMWYIDSTGEQILGPYDMPPPDPYWESGLDPPSPLRDFVFYRGYAPLYKGGKYGAIDKMGQIVIPAMYDRVQILEYGMVGYKVKGNWGVMTVTGKVIMEPTGDGWFYYDGEVLSFYSDNSGEHIEILPDGTTRPYNHDTFDKTTLEINGKEVLLPESSYRDPWATPLPNGTYLVEYFEDTYMSARWRIYDKNANPVSDEVLGHVKYIDLNGSGILQSASYWSQYRVYDLAGNLLSMEIFRDIDPIGSHLMVRTSEHGGVIDAKGNWIIKVPLIDFMPD